MVSTFLDKVSFQQDSHYRLYSFYFSQCQLLQAHFPRTALLSPLLVGQTVCRSLHPDCDFDSDRYYLHSTFEIAQYWPNCPQFAAYGWDCGADWTARTTVRRIVNKSRFCVWHNLLYYTQCFCHYAVATHPQLKSSMKTKNRYLVLHSRWSLVCTLLPCLLVEPGTSFMASVALLWRIGITKKYSVLRSQEPVRGECTSGEWVEV